MTELHENHFWHRRILQVSIITSLLILLFFIAGTVGSSHLSLDVAFHIQTLPAVLAALTLVTAVAANFLMNKQPQAHLPAIVQTLLIVTVAVVIHSSGGIYSYFLPLWLPTVIFIGVFGTRGLIAGAALPLLYALWLLTSDIFTFSMAMTTLLIGEVPVFLSSLLFSHLATQKEDSSYRQLANQFSQVSDKAEVVINAISNGVVALDQQGIVGLINPEAQRLIGWESRDALKLDYKSVLKLVDEDSNELTPANDPVQQVLSTNKEVRTEDYKLVTNSGKKILVSLVVSPVGQQGSGVIVVFRDITKEKAEERGQAEFISTASHEMRTPVASIEGYLGLALNPATAQIDEKARMYITKAHEVAQHLGRLFQDLLDVSKAEDGRLSNNPKAVEVVSFIQDVVEGLRPQAEAKGLILLYKPTPDKEEDDKTSRRLNPVFYANVDNDHLREVVANLVENAIKYTKMGSVSVDVSGDDKQVEISIQDTGIGIPTEDISHLFQKFYRIDNSDTREIGGTGLGLYICRRLVETMEGRIWAESSAGQGSTFFVSIPRISHQEAMQLIEALGEGDEESEPMISPSVGMPQALEINQAAGSDPSALSEIMTQPVVDHASPLAAQPQTHTENNPMISSIEKNPNRYLSRPYTFNVPVRKPRSPGENQNQP